MQIKIIKTGDTRPWTEHIARNLGAKEAKGQYLFMVDVDYIIPKETMRVAYSFRGDRMNIKRRFGILDESGTLKHDRETLKSWNLKERWIRKSVFPGHRSQFLIRKDLFWKLGGYNEGLDGIWRKTGGAGEKFWRHWQRAEMAGKVKMSTDTLTVFMFPNDRFCENEGCNYSYLFHTLTREQ